ncbi:MAG: hypothetical protein NVS9B10_06270 [Nevskia sp.]
MLPLMLMLTGLLSGCAAEIPLVKPSPALLTFNVTNPDQVITIYGDPGFKTTEILTASEPQRPGQGPFDPLRVAGWYEQLSYRRDDQSGLRLFGDARTTVLGFRFFRDKLVGYYALNTVDDVRAGPDEAKLASLVKGRSTQQDVLALLGQPTGRYVYPVIARAGDEMLTYEHVAQGRDGKYEAKKFLQVLFDAEGRLVDYRFENPQKAP